MKTIEFLKANNGDFTKLTDAYGIKVKTYDVGISDHLHVLNYDQIESPKTDPIVMECRGVIINTSLQVVCRPFDRLFNYGEAGTDQLDLLDYVFRPKLDGSLIKVYFWRGLWRIATRGTAFAESDVGAWGITFQDLTLQALGMGSIHEFTDKCFELNMNIGSTYLFELTSPENRVVTPYTDRDLTLLAIRDSNGDYVEPTAYEKAFFKTTPSLVGYTVNNMLKMTAELSGLQEGFIGYDKNGVPRIKLKSAAYVAVHHLRGEGLNPKRIAELVCSGEEDEYLTYFPEDSDTILHYSEKYSEMVQMMELTYDRVNTVESQKEFALAIKDVVGASILFRVRRDNISLKEVLDNTENRVKVRLLLDFMK